MEGINEFITKGPVVLGWEWFADKLKEGMTDIIANYITAFPILIGVSIGVYALISIFSKKLANLGVIGVFLYGGLIVFI